MLINVHGHIGHILPDRPEFIDAARLLAKMDALGLGQTCILPGSEHPAGGYLESGSASALERIT